MNVESFSIFDAFKQDFKRTQKETLTLHEYLEESKTNPWVYANAHQRLLKAIGEPVAIDYDKEPELGRVFGGKSVARYPGFAGFYGIEEQVEKIVSFLRDGANGGEASRQILYFLGPVGSGKTSLATHLRRLMEQEPFYAIEGSPVFDNPLNIFNPRTQAGLLERFHIDPRVVKTTLSPWALKKLREFDGDLSQFRVVRLYPSISEKIASARVEPGDENNQDQTSLVGKVSLTKLEKGLEQSDPYAYDYSGMLNRGNRGIGEFVEMFKAPIKTLNPMLTATQENFYDGSEPIGSIPFEGILIAHSNESEWEAFRKNNRNEAFLDRVIKIDIPNMLRTTDELKIYEKYIKSTGYGGKPIAPGTLELLVNFAVSTRLMVPKDTAYLLSTKRKVYNGERPGEDKAKTLAEYREEARVAGYREGMEGDGFSPRNAYKILSAGFNEHASEGEVSLSAIDLIARLESVIKTEFPKEREKPFLEILTDLKKDYVKTAGKEIREALLESGQGYAQDIFVRYYHYADLLSEDHTHYVDPFSESPLTRDDISKKLEEVEKKGGIRNPKDFRNEIIKFVLRYKTNNNGKMPDWKGHGQFAEAIGKITLEATEADMPFISFTTHKNAEDKEKHEGFVRRMMDRGYTTRQVRQAVEYYQRNRLG